MAQSIASIAVVLVAFGWGITGPSAVASMRSAARGQYFFDSVVSRAWLFLVAAPIAAVLMWFIAPGDSHANVLAGITAILPALGASWFFIGEKRPWTLLLFETAPRAIGTIAGAVMLAATGSIIYFACLQLLGSLLAVVVSAWEVTRRHRQYSLNLGIRAAADRLRAQTAGILTAGTSALYVNVPLLLVAMLAPQATTFYAAADKLMKFALTAYSPVVQIAQGYVPCPNREEHNKRALLASRAALGIGFVAGGGFFALAPLGVHLLTAGQASISHQLSAPLGLVLGSVAISAVLGTACLTSLGAIRKVAESTVLGAVCGVPLIVLGGFIFGIYGIAWATAISELAVAIYQARQLSSVIARRRKEDVTD